MNLPHGCEALSYFAVLGTRGFDEALLRESSSLPGTDQRYREEDDAWERLKRLGLNPKEYFD